ncbi:Mbeg1-like protein [Breznakiella homolactica]|uniref:DUF2974 domain-containing protein n=1 Tax=Breznakiella homolactica TaxID=2798577 RepID=A0A7T7XLL9_9SPIR|nr:Mbeg1-like protein [Breznakiella homolactica]QQO08473.1 DUF2974 domain-containing protein [Breznakiella homolactica]
MANILDYLNWRGDLPFSCDPVNTVDEFILSRISYLPFEGILPGEADNSSITIGEASEIFKKLRSDSRTAETLRIIWPDDIPFFESLGQNERYRSLRLTRYVNHINTAQEKQFSAVTILTGDGSVFVSYRGTDNTLVGWKEDFNMAFLSNTPSQLEAVSYLKETAAVFRKEKLVLGGHSKGGNLAVYAAVFCGRKIQNRITSVYTEDAPGISKEILSAEEYSAVKQKIRAFVPQGSVVGMLFEHPADYTVVESTQKGLLQHNIYSWQVTRNDVVRLNTVTKGSVFMDQTLNEWISGLTSEQRRQFAETIYTVLISTSAETIPQFTSSWYKHASDMVKALKEIDKPTRDAAYKAVGALFKAAQENMGTLLAKDREKTGNTPKGTDSPSP